MNTLIHKLIRRALGRDVRVQVDIIGDGCVDIGTADRAFSSNGPGTVVGTLRAGNIVDISAYAYPGWRFQFYLGTTDQFDNGQGRIGLRDGIYYGTGDNFSGRFINNNSLIIGHLAEDLHITAQFVEYPEDPRLDPDYNPPHNPHKSSRQIYFDRMSPGDRQEV